MSVCLRVPAGSERGPAALLPQRGAGRVRVRSGRCSYFVAVIQYGQ